MLLAVAVAALLVAGGFGAAVWGYRDARSCREKWDDTPEAAVDCEDSLTHVTVYGGGLTGVVGAVTLGLLARRVGALDLTDWP